MTRKRTYGNGMTLEEVKAAQQRWLDIFELRRIKGLAYKEIAARYRITDSRAQQLCVKGEWLTKQLAERPRPPWVADVWGEP